MLNWLLGVEASDLFRLVLVDDSSVSGKQKAESVTQFITVYKIRHLPGMSDILQKKNIMIVDSPGFGDT